MEFGQKYYRVTVHRAHQGRGRTATLTFYIAARDAIHASNIARRMPGVKHSRGVVSCISISTEEYMQGRTRSAYHMNGIT